MEEERKTSLKKKSAAMHEDALNQNLFGIRVIGISMLVVGLGITLLGALAPKYSGVVITVGMVIFASALIIIYASRKRERKMDERFL